MFKALVARRGEQGISIAWEQLSETDLMPGDVDVEITHSTVNYKDGLALTGKAPIVRKFPLICGVDFAGKVTASTLGGFQAGDNVILNGFGIGETHHGGYAERARVKGDWLIKTPAAFTNAEAMAIGTAGYTAMLCVMALERQGVTAESGPVLVTGAAGGVGSVAVTLLAKLGFHVIASTGRMSESGYLKSLGATEILDRATLQAPAKPLGPERWAGAIDVAGSHTLANVISMTKYGGAVAATGLAQGMDLPSSVMPFILRNVTLAGVDSVMAPLAKRIAAWDRLARDLDRAKLSAMTETHPLRDVLQLAPKIIKGEIRGRIVLDAKQI